MEIVVSEESKRRLIRFANAVREYEVTHWKIFFRDGYTDLGPSAAAITERAAAKADLANCPELEVKELVHQIQIERIDEAMADESKTELDVVRASNDALIAENELVYLGHKLEAEQASEPKPLLRRKGHGRRRNRRPDRRKLA